MTMSPAGSTTSRRHLEARSVCGSSSVARSTSRARSALAGASSFASPPSSSSPTSARVCSIHGNAASIVAGVSRTPGRISVANARVDGNAALSESKAALALRSVGAQLADRGPQVRRLARERRRRGVEVGDQVLELVLVAGELVGGVRRAADQPRDVAAGLGAEQRLEHLRGRALGGGDVVERVVEGLRRRSARAPAARTPRPARPSARSSSAALRPSSTPWRSSRESLCSDVRTSSSCTGVAVWVILIVSPESSSARARRARLEVDEEVALEEDARADLGRRVLVQRQRGVVELQHQHGAVGALHALDGLDLADLHARDPDRRVGPDRVRRLELRPDLEAAA